MTDAELLADLRRRLANQRASLDESDRALMALGARLRETEEKLHAALRRLDRIADVLQGVRAARPSPANSTKPTLP